MNRILVIGPTGNVGRHVLTQLRQEGADARAMSRHPGPNDVYGDLSLPDTLTSALDGIDSVFLVWTAPASAAIPALDVITKRVKRIVYLSAPYKTAHPLFQGAQPNPMSTLHAQIERKIEDAGIEWTFLRPGMFAGNAGRWWTPQIKTGNVVRWPYTAVSTAPIDERDIAAVAVRCLSDEGHTGTEYLLTGPRSHTHADQVEIIGRAMGRPLRLEEISPDEARHELLPILPPAAIEMLLAAWKAAAGHPAFMTSTVERITRRRAKSFEEWATAFSASY